MTGYYHTCAITPSGTVRCWGLNDTGQLSGAGWGDVDQRARSGARIDQRGRSGPGPQPHLCAHRDPAGVLLGSNNSGQLGKAGEHVHPQLVAGSNIDGKTVQITAGEYFTCALTSPSAGQGVPYCWGENYVGQLGSGDETTTTADGLMPTDLDNPTPSKKSFPTPRQVKKSVNVNVRDFVFPNTNVAPLTNVVKLVAGPYHACALLSDSTLMCWGSNHAGQLGRGSIPADPDGDAGPIHLREVTDSFFNAAVPSTVIKNVADMALGQDVTCVLKTDNSVFCYGLNHFGQLGSNQPEGALAFPQRVLGITGIKSISAGYNHACAATTSGYVYCWGLNTSGQLGKGSFSPAKTGVPQLIPNLNGVVGVGAAAFHTCVVKQTGALLCFGDNGFGAIGGSHAPDGAPAESDHNVSLTASHAGESDSATPTVVAGLTVETQNQTVSGGSTPPPVITVDEPYRGLASPVRLVDTRNANSTIDNLFDGDGKISGDPAYEVTIAGRGGSPPMPRPCSST
ncbi:MAG: hypothetical protein R2705_24780 [Ilumatobacteraceae bacterium]